MLRDKVFRWCRQHALFSSGDTVWAALSGGADSVAMLHLLLALRDDLGITVRAAHYNHHLRGAESDRDEAFCRGLCAELGVELFCGGGDVAAEAARTGKSIELAARELRYAFLLSLGGKAATAHTADDNAETVLLNLTRGTALRGLGGIPPQRDSVVRPVLCLTRFEIEAYLAEQGLSHITDSTNLEDFCFRNRVRHHVIPALAAENPALPGKLLSMTEALRADETYLQAQADALLASARRDGGFEAAALAAAPAPIRSRALRRLLEKAGVHSLSAAHLAAADGLLSSDSPSASVSLPGLVLRRQYGLLALQTEEWPPFEPFFLPMPGRHPLSGGRILSCAGPIPYANQHGLCLVLTDAPMVRPRKSGDRLHLPGGTKALKALMIDRKIPAVHRRGIPVLELRGEVIAACGVGADPAYCPAPGQPCYHLEIRQETERGNTDDQSV